MSAKLDNYSNTGNKWDWLCSGDILQTQILKNAASVLLVTFITNGKKETGANLVIGDET
jgi:hypothetical protein